MKIADLVLHTSLAIYHLIYPLHIPGIFVKYSRANTLEVWSTNYDICKTGKEPRVYGMCYMIIKFYMWNTFVISKDIEEWDLINCNLGRMGRVYDISIMEIKSLEKI